MLADAVVVVVNELLLLFFLSTKLCIDKDVSTLSTSFELLTTVRVLLLVDAVVTFSGDVGESKFLGDF